jgi:ribonuclease HI
MTRPARPSTTPPGSARLFSETHAGAPAGVYIANVDGASRGNPGPASYAVILRDPNGRVVLELGKKLGRDTNNVAEYYALLAALDYAVTHGIKALRIRSDSELLVRQMQGRYKVKSADLKPLHERASKLSWQLEYFVIEHVAREMNRDADALANLALDSSAVPSAETRNSKAETRPATQVHGSASGAGSATAQSSTASSRSIRARFLGGVFVPAETVSLPEGSEVILTVRKP